MSAVVEARLFSVQQASKYLSIPENTLNAWRLRAKGPPFVRVNKADLRNGRIPRRNVVRYSREDLDAWIASLREVPSEAAHLTSSLNSKRLV